MAFQPLSLTDPGVSSPTFMAGAADVPDAEEVVELTGVSCFAQAANKRRVRAAIRFMGRDCSSASGRRRVANGGPGGLAKRGPWGACRSPPPLPPRLGSIPSV